MRSLRGRKELKEELKGDRYAYSWSIKGEPVGEGQGRAMKMHRRTRPVHAGN